MAAAAAAAAWLVPEQPRGPSQPLAAARVSPAFMRLPQAGHSRANKAFTAWRWCRTRPIAAFAGLQLQDSVCMTRARKKATHNVEGGLRCARAVCGACHRRRRPRARAQPQGRRQLPRRPPGAKLTWCDDVLLVAGLDLREECRARLPPPAALRACVVAERPWLGAWTFDTRPPAPFNLRREIAWCSRLTESPSRWRPATPTPGGRERPHV